MAVVVAVVFAVAVVVFARAIAAVKATKAS